MMKSPASNGSTTGRESSYPYSRAEECGWQPEEVARHLSSLLADEKLSEPTQLLHHGWSSRHVHLLEAAFGKNIVGQDDNDVSAYWIFRKLPFLQPVGSAMMEQLKEPLILMLLFSAGISILLGNSSDAISIGIALLIVSLVAAIQEYRSEQALEQLAHLVPPTCTCLRDGRVLDHFPARELVVGDLVLLATGDRIPADCRVVDSVELRVDESSLTGENHPVNKTGEGIVFSPSKVTAPSITDQTNIVFCGTLVTAGRGRALVLAVGAQTEFGQVATELQSVTTRKSPLQNKIDELGKRLAYLSSAAIAIIALMGLLLGRPLLETLTVAVSLAVAAIPEGLPICTTVTLALGVLRMSKRNAIVKKLPVVESLGCATAICSDKTGTLTQNEMTARAVYTLAYRDRKFGLTGVGYATMSGKLVTAKSTGSRTIVVDPTSEEYTALSALFCTACLCNNATVVTDIDSNMMDGHSGGAMSGQPTELALLVASDKARVTDPRPQYHRIQEVPFSSERKRMEVRARPVSGRHCCHAFEIAMNRRQHTSTDGSMYFVKGMPESLLEQCTTHIGSDGSPQQLDHDGKELVMINARKMAASGLRVLAMAYGPSLDQLTFVGIVGMEDPPRDGVAESVWQLRHGGVRVMMVTGDSRETALAIARRCGIVGTEGDQVGISQRYSTDSLDDYDDGSAMSDVELAGEVIAMSGDDLDSIPSHHLSDSIANIKVFYRVAPRHKLAIVRALQKNGDIVAMTGDGE